MFVCCRQGKQYSPLTQI